MVRKHTQFLTIDDAAGLLRVSKTSLRRWTNSGRLRCYRVGLRNERRFLIDDLLDFLPPGEEGAKTELRRRIGASGDRGALAPPAAALRRHLCMHFRSPAEQREMLRPYLQRAVAEGAAIHYIHDFTPREEVERWLIREGLDLEAASEAGRLRIVPSRRAYLLTGEFSVQRMLDYVESAILGARAAGFERALFAGEMTWFLTGAPGCEHMAEYESLLNPLIEKFPGVTIVCQYPLNRFDSATTIDALKAHPAVELADGIYAGFYGD